MIDYVSSTINSGLKDRVAWIFSYPVNPVFILCILILSPILAATIIIPDDYPTIQDGIEATSDGDTVLVNPGIYNENINFSGHNISVISLYLESGNPIYQQTTIIDAEGFGTVVKFESGEDSTATLAGLTIISGAGSQDPEDLEGGGITIINADPQIMSNIISQNNALEGGGIRLSNSGSIISDCRIIDNTSQSGGGIYAENSEFRISGCIVEGNTATGVSDDVGGDGGGIYIYNSTFDILQTIVYGNLIESGIPDNWQTMGAGGGIYITDSDGLLEDVEIHSNVSDLGAGLVVGSCPWITLRRTLISDNLAITQSPGIRTYGGSWLAIVNSTITNNQVLGDAEEIGRSIFSDEAALLISNSIIWSDTPGNDIYNGAYYGGIVSISHTDIEGGLQDVQNILPDLLNYGEGIMDVNPLFENPESGDYHLSEDSPCIDAGNPDLDDDGITWVEDEDDQDPDGSQLDLGAFYHHQDENTIDGYVTIENVDLENGSLEIWMDIFEGFGHFSFQISGVNLVDVENADLGTECGYMVSFNSSGLVVIFGLLTWCSQGTYQIGTFIFDEINEPEICISDFSISSSETWEPLYLDLEDCFPTGYCTPHGDLNDDASLDILDVILTVNCVLENDECLCADFDDDGSVDIIDVVLMVGEIMEEG